MNDANVCTGFKQEAHMQRPKGKYDEMGDSQRPKQYT